MNNDFVELLKIYGTKIDYEFTTFEQEQLKGLYLLYGKGAVLLVLKSLENISIPTVARALMQIGGFCDSVPPSLNGLILTSVEAGNKYNEVQIEVAGRLKNLVKLLSDPAQMEFFTLGQDGKTFHHMWQENSGQKPTENESSALNYALMEFGTSLVERAIRLIAGQNIGDEEKRIDVFQQWLVAASTRDINDLEMITKDAGFESMEITWGLPIGCPFLVTAYYYAKKNIALDDNDILALNKLIMKSSAEEVVFSICLIPSDEISIDALIQKHLERTGSVSDRVYAILERQKGVYDCETCGDHLVVAEEDATDAVIYPNCPMCSNGDIKTHFLKWVLPEIDKELLRRFQEEDPMTYEADFSRGGESCDYCQYCGHFFYGSKSYTTLNEI